jgi:hexosaminidase
MVYIDESYKLSVPASGKPVFAFLEAQTVYGALHMGFKHSANYTILTLEPAYEVPMVPWTVITSWLRIRDKLLEGCSCYN